LPGAFSAQESECSGSECADAAQESHALLHVKGAQTNLHGVMEESQEEVLHSAPKTHDVIADGQSLSESRGQGDPERVMKTKVVIKQPDEKAPGYTYRSWERNASKLAGECLTLDDMKCGPPPGSELCLKWHSYCYADRIDVPPGIKVTMYTLGWGKWTDPCSGKGNSKVQGRHTLPGEHKFKQGSVCAFSFEKAPIYYQIKSTIYSSLCVDFYSNDNEPTYLTCGSYDKSWETQYFTLETRKIKTFKGKCLGASMKEGVENLRKGACVHASECGTDSLDFEIHGQQIRVAKKPALCLRLHYLGTYSEPCIKFGACSGRDGYSPLQWKIDHDHEEQQ